MNKRISETTWELLERRTDGSSLVRIARGKETGIYTLRATATGPGCWHVLIHKEPGEEYAPAERECYQVEVAEDTGVCTCFGYLRWRKPCKHIEAVLGLVEAGHFEETPMTEPNEPNDPNDQIDDLRHRLMALVRVVEATAQDIRTHPAARPFWSSAIGGEWAVGRLLEAARQAKGGVQ